MIDAFDWLTLAVLVGLFVALGGWVFWITRKRPVTTCPVCGEENGGMDLHFHSTPLIATMLDPEPATDYLKFAVELTDEMIEAQSWAVHPTWSVKHRWSRIDYVNGATWARDFLNESITAHND